MPLDCTTTFASNGAVKRFGGAARGNLKADGDDLTGQGVRHSSVLSVMQKQGLIWDA